MLVPASSCACVCAERLLARLLSSQLCSTSGRSLIQQATSTAARQLSCLNLPLGQTDQRALEQLQPWHHANARLLTRTVPGAVQLRMRRGMATRIEYSPSYSCTDQVGLVQQLKQRGEIRSSIVEQVMLQVRVCACTWVVRHEDALGIGDQSWPISQGLRSLKRRGGGTVCLAASVCLHMQLHHGFCRACASCRSYTLA